MGSMTMDFVRNTLHISGMTCTSCEVIIERKLKTIPGIRAVQVNHNTGRCVIESDRNVDIPLSVIQAAITPHGYKIEPWSNQTKQSKAATRRLDNNSKGNGIHQQHQSWLTIGVTLVAVVTMYFVLKALGLTNFAPQIDKSVSLSAAFIIGLVASTSTCLAVVGGLVMGLSATMAEHQTTTNRWQRLRPHLWFQAGRLISYFVLGGVIGAIGQVLTLSPRASGSIALMVAVMMVILGLDLLGVVNLKRYLPRLPKWFAHTLHDVAETPRPWTPITLGALTFFLPCGFTQAMQLYVLTTGSFWQGGLTMLLFALGTMPTLLGIGLASSLVRGRVMRTVIRVAGAAVLILGFYNFTSGWRLVGLPTLGVARSTEAVADQAAVPIVDGQQIVNMQVNGIQYLPNEIVVKAGVPVEWRIDGSKATGCTSVITIPQLGITQVLDRNQETVINFTPPAAGTLPFTCSMGMAYGEFIVT